MDVLSSGPLRVTSAVWQPRVGTWAIAVACKATFRLEPGECPLVDACDDFVEDDVRSDAGVGTSALLRAGEVVPFKPNVDVVLVGHAFAPGGRPVRSMTARLVVGAIDKRIEVWCDRIFWHDGNLLEGQPFAKMPLVYERAAGGPGTPNPAGLRWDAPPDARGAVPVPNLQPPRKRVSRRGDTFPTVGFGPIAPTWPSRVEKLGRYAGAIDPARWREQPLPPDFDPAFFNVAPIDQQIQELQPDEFILLEGLHGSHPRLETSLPGERPIARITSGLRAGEEISLTADTLTIDTDRGIATVVWRANVGLGRKDEPGQVTIALDGAVAPVAAPPMEEGTKVLEEGDNLGAKAALPFSGKRLPPRAQTVLGARPAGPALPFSAAMSPWATQGSAKLVRPEPVEPADTGTDRVVKAKEWDVLPFPSAAARPMSLADVVPPRPSEPSPIAAPVAAPPPLFTLQTGQSVVDPRPADLDDEETPPIASLRAATSPAPEKPAEPKPAGEPKPVDVVDVVDVAPDAAPGQPEQTEQAEKEVSLESCAAVTASLARTPDDRAKILEASKLDEKTFKAAEKRWRKALKEETAQGKRALAQRYDAAYVDQLEKERGPIELAEYARLVVAGERGNLPDVLTALGLPRAAMLPIERVWLKKMLADVTLGKKLTAAVKAARAS